MEIAEYVKKWKIFLLDLDGTVYIDGALIGATATRIMRNSVFISMAAFFATYYGLLNLMGNNALWLAFMVFLVLRGVLQYVMTGGLKKLI